MLRLLAQAALEEMTTITLSETLLQVAAIAWSAVAQRRKTPALIRKLPRLVDEFLELQGASYAMRAKTYALLLSLSPLARVALLVEGSRRTHDAQASASLPSP